jgi:hypothetical protein
MAYRVRACVVPAEVGAALGENPTPVTAGNQFTYDFGDNMLTENSSPVERVQSSYRKLFEVASALNKVSDALGQMIAELDLALKKLNLGITIWVQLKGNVDQETLDYSTEDLGYAKVRGKWGIALRTFSQNYHYPEDAEREEWPFNDAPRQLRLSAIEKIPELLEKLSEQAAQTTEEICCKVAETEELVTAVKTAAGKSSECG